MQPEDAPLPARDKLDDLLPAVYEEMRSLASRQLARERNDHTLQTTALVHEAYLRLSQQREVEWSDEREVLRAAIGFMRRILVDHARRKNAEKRRADGARLSLTDVAPAAKSTDVDPVELDEALTKLQELDPRQALIVELRYFGGLTLAETAENCQVSLATVKREWNLARAWLFRHLQMP